MYTIYIVKIQENLMIKIYSKPLIDNVGAGAMYAIARALDMRGQGWVRLDIKALRQSLTVSERTIWRRIKKAQVLGYFREIERSKNVVFVKYLSCRKLKKLTNGLVAETYVNMTEFSDLSNIKSIAYEAAIIAQQLRTQYAMKKSTQIKPNTVVEPNIDLQSWRGNRRCAGVNAKTNSVFLTKNSKVATSKQSTVANQVGRTRQTVLRHAKKIKRFRINIEQVKKYLPENWRTDGRYWQDNIKSLARTHTLTLSGGATKVVKVFKHKAKVYRRMPNLYVSDRIVKAKEARDNSKETLNNKQVRQWEKYKQSQRKLTLEKVLANLSDEHLTLTAHSFMLFFRGQTAPVINTWSREQIINGITQTIKSCLSASLPLVGDHDLLQPSDQVKELALRVQDPAEVCPLPWGIYTELRDLFNDNTLVALKGTKLDPALANKYAYNTMYDLLPVSNERFMPARRVQPFGETWIDYVGRVMNLSNLQKLVSSAILVYAEQPYKLTGNETYSELIELLQQLPDNNYQGKKKEKVVREMVRRRLKSKSCLPHYYLFQLQREKQFELD